MEKREVRRDDFTLFEGEKDGVILIPEYGNDFGMPQVQLPIFPAGVTSIRWCGCWRAWVYPS